MLIPLFPPVLGGIRSLPMKFMPTQNQWKQNLQMQLVKMRSYWIRVGLKSKMICVVRRERNWDTDTYAGKRRVKTRAG